VGDGIDCFAALLFFALPFLYPFSGLPLGYFKLFADLFFAL
jgi:hypothetical protein